MNDIEQSEVNICVLLVVTGIFSGVIVRQCPVLQVQPDEPLLTTPYPTPTSLPTPIVILEKHPTPTSLPTPIVISNKDLDSGDALPLIKAFIDNHTGSDFQIVARNSVADACKEEGKKG
jgi:hypothetical protein